MAQVHVTVGGKSTRIPYSTLFDRGAWNQQLLSELYSSRAKLHCMCKNEPVPMFVRRAGKTRFTFSLITKRNMQHSETCPRYYHIPSTIHDEPQRPSIKDNPLDKESLFMLLNNPAIDGEEWRPSEMIGRGAYVPRLDELNAQQYQAATHGEGPCIVLAGAGSGKTATLMSRIKYLVDNGADPNLILAATFAKKAAEEMQARVRKELGQQRGKQVVISTLHSVAYRLVMPSLGPDWSVLQDPSYILESVFEYPSDYNKYGLGPIMDPADAKQAIDKLKADGKRPEDISGDIGLVYRSFEAIKKSRKFVDFEDLIMEAIRLFQEDKEFANRWRNRWQYVMVDEFQDTNMNQWKFILELVKNHRNLQVVGDDKQSLYSFRNARPELMREFVHTFPDAKVVKLIMNYRSNAAVVDLSNQVIELNRGNHVPIKAISYRGESGDCITDCVSLKTDVQEARWVAQEIQRLKREKTEVPYKEYAILYRTNLQSRVFEEALAELDIPYQIIGDTHFYESKDVQVILNYLRTALDQSDPSVWVPLLNRPKRYIPKSVVQEVRDGGWPSLVRHEKCQGFLKAIEQLTRRKNPGDAIEWLVKSQEGLVKQSDDKEPVGWVQSLITSARRYETVPEFLRFVDWVIEKSKEPKDDAVQCLTIHRSKGLEYWTVFVAGCVEGLLPYKKALEEGDVREETRIAYVAMTRAKENLYMLAAEQYGETPMEVSRYIKALQA